MLLIGRRYDNGQPIRVEVNGNGITDLEDWRGTERGRLPWLAPGLIDLQINGHGGKEFTDPALTEDDVERIARAADAAGVTSFLATVTTQAHDTQVHALRIIASAIDTRTSVSRRISGVHLEGPFISSQDGPRGAHPLAHCRPPDWDAFQQLQDAADGRIRLLTMSPEYPESDQFIRRAVDRGVLVAIGHTNADADQIRAAVDAGASLSTHLGNGTHAMIRRHPNYIWDQLADDRLTATMIADGHHLPPAVIKCFIRVKTPERLVLVSDAMGLAGMPAGRYETPNQGIVDVNADGLACLAERPEYLAGATLPLSHAIANVMRFGEVNLAAAIDMASAHPAEQLGLPAGQLQRGETADLIQFHLKEDGTPLQLVATVNQGECVYGTVVDQLASE